MNTLEDWSVLQAFLKKKIYARRLKSRQIWLPLSDRETEDVWKDHSGTTIQNYTLPWIGGTADWKKIENCARIIDEKIWGDKRCDFPEFACVCSYKPNFHLKLRGLCPSSAIDVFYKPINDWADFRQLKLQGLKQTSITYDEAKKIWSLKVAQSNMSATSKASHSSYTLGKNNWTVTGDKYCNDGKEYATELKMSGCQDGSFTCNDGQCVSMNKRCN